MVKISPSILSTDFNKIEETINSLNNTSCEYIHIDVMDGKFVPNKTFPIDLIKKVKKISKKKLDVHLMIESLEEKIKEYIEIKPEIITFHYEAAIKNNIYKLIKMIKKEKIKCGISIKPKTSVSEIKHLLKEIDLLLIMSVEPGKGGQEFIKFSLEKIKEAKKEIIKNNLDVLIEVDGGINNITAPLAIESGADILVSGNYLLKQNNLEGAINSLRNK